MSRTRQTVTRLTVFWVRVPMRHDKTDRTTNGRLHQNGRLWQVLDTP